MKPSNKNLDLADRPKKCIHCTSYNYMPYCKKLDVKILNGMAAIWHCGQCHHYEERKKVKKINKNGNK